MFLTLNLSSERHQLSLLLLILHCSLCLTNPLILSIFSSHVNLPLKSSDVNPHENNDLFIPSTSAINFAPSSPISFSLFDFKFFILNRHLFKYGFFTSQIQFFQWCICFQCFTKNSYFFFSNFFIYSFLSSHSILIRVDWYTYLQILIFLLK